MPFRTHLPRLAVSLLLLSASAAAMAAPFPACNLMTQQTAASKGAFASIKQEKKTLLEGHQTIIAGTMKAINADALQEASVKIINACKRMEQAVATLTTLIYAKGTVEEIGLAPEEAAPAGNTIYGRSTGAIQDEEAEAEFET